MKRVVLFVVISTILVMVGWTQTLLFGFGAELDGILNDFNISAKADIGGFSIEVSNQWGASTAQVNSALSQGLTPAEVFVAAFLAKTSGKQIDTVVTQYKNNKSSGWGSLASSLGIKPGSEAFKALKDKTKGSTTKIKGRKK